MNEHCAKADSAISVAEVCVKFRQYEKAWTLVQQARNDLSQLSDYGVSGPVESWAREIRVRCSRVETRLRASSAMG